MKTARLCLEVLEDRTALSAGTLAQTVQRQFLRDSLTVTGNDRDRDEAVKLIKLLAEKDD